MNRSGRPVIVAGDLDDLHAVASIWTSSTAVRDRCRTPCNLSSAVAGIRRRLDVAGAAILVAETDFRTVGFVLFAPRGRILEIFYLAVDPAMWGEGIATQLLRSVETHARTVDCATLELWVIDDNDRAIRVYESAGWIGTDVTQVDSASGRVERRLVRDAGWRKYRPVTCSSAQFGCGTEGRTPRHEGWSRRRWFRVAVGDDMEFGDMGVERFPPGACQLHPGQSP
jgi:GNAT superfamily N-acetyltransferase